jgi:hypothetical protein
MVTVLVARAPRVGEKDNKIMGMMSGMVSDYDPY